MPESGYHAPGTESDPRAPWNEPEPEPCADCEGQGTGPTYNADGTDGPARPCPRCGGTGDEPEDDQADAPGVPEAWER